MQPPTVEMLWESQDPGRALEERFGFADAASAGGWVAAMLHDHWGIGIGACERIVISDRNALAWVTAPFGRLVAKWSVAPTRFPRLSQVAELTRWLDGLGLPVSAPVPAADGRLLVELEDVSLCLQRVVPGELLGVEHRDQVWAAGVVLARLHHALADYPGTDRIVPPDERPEPLAARIRGWLGSAGEQVPETERTTLRRLVDDAPQDLLATQLVHGDYRSANILCTGAEVAAVLDFEEARLDPCIDELARSAVMLGTRFRDWGPVASDVHERFRAGYESVRRLTAPEASSCGGDAP